MPNLSEFFFTLTTNKPLPYQIRYGADPFTHTLLIVPTGLGKTDTVLVPWLHSIASNDRNAPKRLIFTLPRVNLTEQVTCVIRKRVQSAGLEKEVAVLELMGGSSDNRKPIAPDRPTILVGTQDILVSRAVNRGYARRPFHWPIDFALLNNDCLWIFDEIQLMSDSLATSTQLAAFREQYGLFGRVPCVWMSATVDPKWLETVDFAALAKTVRIIQLADDDKKTEVVAQRVQAAKTLSPAPVECQSPAGCAEFLLTQHKAGERSLVIANTVNRAREIATELRKKTETEVVLLHSRFRPKERQDAVNQISALPDQGHIIVSTQVIEAGIDISAHRLITDIAPWSSLVQRFGRVNRYGSLPASRIWWVERPLSSKQQNPKRPESPFAPYETSEVESAIALARQLTSAAPSDLPSGTSAPIPWRNVLRRADLLDLFDTSPDLSGNEIDVSRFIRSGEERDCYLAWREWDGDAPPPSMPRIDDRELCPVPIGEARAFAKKSTLFVWDFLARQWRQVESDRWYPGMIGVIRCSGGGYTAQEGWSPGSKARVDQVDFGDLRPEQGYADDWKSWVSYRQSLSDHTEMVVNAMSDLLQSLLSLDLSEVRDDLVKAAEKHDWGKAHPVMQRTLHKASEWTELLAKQERGKAELRHERRYFRHELASALAMLTNGDSDMSAYLVAAHHGRIRVSLRSMPGEHHGTNSIARGIHQGDVLPGCNLTRTLTVPETILSLDIMQLGSKPDEPRSWSERALKLRDRLGPFKLAFLEMLLRTADTRASDEAGRRATCSN